MSQGEASTASEQKPAEAAAPEKPAAGAAAPAQPQAAPVDDSKPAEGAAPAAEGEKKDEAPPGVKGDRATHFIFEHKVFAIQNSKFLLAADTHRPVLSVPLGALKGMMDLQLVRASFGIKAGSPDDQVLAVVAKSLKYVKDIRPGDTIPNELLDG